ncbi:piRNA biogenesis protein EXD1 [Genypterus blacodes]|uniref:piRNA biogenesis protein EXD1 n=1 Tax=Genypterus blacodes TaxID=154954 RepID=UPI003F7596CF
MDILKGKRVKLTLKSSSFCGVLQHVNPNKTVVLADVVNGSDGSRIPGSKLFFGREILNVEFIGEATADSGQIHEDKPEDHLTEEEFWPNRNVITSDDEDKEHISYVVIDDYLTTFTPAVIHIKKHRVISIGADGVEVFQHGRLCWLQIATKIKVYLFDILALGSRAFKNGLSMILEDQHILKVIHDCRAVSGCLIAQFGVKLANVFDTQVADVMCFHSESGGFLPDRVCSLQEVLSLHLKVPPSRLLSLQMKSQLSEEERKMWSKRPCPVPLLKVMALSVIHLQPLRLLLMDALMSDYMALVDSYLSSSHYKPDELQHVNMGSVLDLPQELRELERTVQERRVLALKQYPVTEGGLLDRSKPRAQPSTQTTTRHSLQPAGQQSPPSAKVDLLPPRPPTGPPLVSSVSSSLPLDLPPPLVPAAQAPLTAAASGFRKQASLSGLQSAAAGRGLARIAADTMGRGRGLGKDRQSSFPAFPSIGRGFLLQMPPARAPGDVNAPERTKRSGS